MTKPKGLGDRMRSRRIELGWSLTELAHKLNMSVSQASKYESNDRTPRADIASRIAQALGVNLDWLLTGDGQKDEQNAGFPMRIRTINTPREPEHPDMMTLTFSFEITRKLRELAQHFGVQEVPFAMNLIYDAVDAKHEQVLKEMRKPRLESLINEADLQKAIAELIPDPKFQEGLASIVLINKVLEALTPEEISIFDAQFHARHGQEPKDRSAYFREMLEFYRNRPDKKQN